VVEEPGGQGTGAAERLTEAAAEEGRSYVIDVVIAQRGPGAASATSRRSLRFFAS